MSKNNRKILLPRLVHHISFLENTAESEVADPIWNEKFSCFAEVTPLSECNYMSIEGLNFGNFITEEYYLFRIRYMDGLNKTLQISFAGKLYSIKRIINIKQRSKLLNIITHEIA